MSEFVRLADLGGAEHPASEWPAGLEMRYIIGGRPQRRG